MQTRLLLSLAALAVLAGCASVPTGPNVMALPGTGVTFEQFRADDLMCRDFAYQQIGGKAREQTGSHAAIGSAAVGTAIGAVAGAAIGGQRGAGVGAGTGLIIGSATGAEASRSVAYGSQRQYDIAYVQCMYAKGHRVPVSASYTPARIPAASPGTPPPPPAGMPPPPPNR
ncbi:MAG: glycine zipper family protein [Rhodocyclaceae bacterium]|nr:glycine zipper family protein [Rhodocyclaceae bacterium]MDP3032266.1 glycine zipper family protein [Rhodocyclaceae bacterium]